MDTTLETWENVTLGVVWVMGSDHRGAERTVRIDGGARVKLKTEDREGTEVSKPGNNPFQNGRLRRVDEGADPSQRAAATTDDELREVATTDDLYFLREWLTTETELNARRLAAIVKSEKLGSYAASDMIRTIVTERFPHLDYTPEHHEIMSSARD